MTAADRPADAPPAAADVVALAVAAPSHADAVRLLRAAPADGSADLAAALSRAAVAHLRRDPRRVFWIARTAARRAEASGDRRSAAQGHRIAGCALLACGRPRSALANHDRALRLLAGVEGSEPEVAAVHVKRIHPLALLGRHGDARHAAEAALAVRIARGDAVGVSEVEMALGDQLFRQDRFREALRHYTRARNGLPAEKYARLRANLDCNSANCLEALHRWSAASRLFERARAVYEGAGLHQTVALVDHNRAYFAFLRGRYADALALYDRAEAVFGEIGDTRHLGQVALERAEVHLQLGTTRDARDQAVVAAERFARAGLGRDRAQALVLAEVARLVEGGGGAEASLDAARATLAAEGSEVGAAECDVLRAAAAERHGALSDARALLAGAQDVFERHGLAQRAGSAELALARVDLAAGDAASALRHAERASQRLRGISGPALDVELARCLGLARIAAGDADGGADALWSAVAALERQRGAVPADECMVAFLASRAALCAEAASALVRVGREEDAFDVCERVRARALDDLLNDRSRRGSHPRALADIRADRLREELNALYLRLHRHASGIEALADDRVAEMRAATVRRERDLAATLRRRTAAAGALPVVQSEMVLERLQARLAADETLVEYLDAPDGLHAFVVRRDAFAHRRLAVTPADVAAFVQRFRFHLAKFDVAPAMAASELSLRATRANLAALAAAILDPLRDLVRTRRVVIVPSPSLHGIPFHALPAGAGGWSADEHDFVCAPSAAVYVRCGTRGAQASGAATVLALPDEAAPLVEREARAVARALGTGTRCHTGPGATVARLREAARTSRVLHLATHGMFRADEPSLSRLRLADAWISLHDVHDLDVRCGLVVLSACESGSAAVSAAGDPEGMLRGFLVAGAPCVVASQWRVADEAAALFMESFYASLDRGPETALRAARAAVRRRFPHPYHWAAFFLFGHPGGFRGRRPEEMSGGRASSAEPFDGRVACARGS